MEGQKAAAWIAASVVALGAGAVRYGDNVVRYGDNVGRSVGLIEKSHPTEIRLPREPPSFPRTRAPVIPPRPNNDVETAIDSGASFVEHRYGAARESAREAATSAACGVLRISLVNGRLPTENEWVDIAVGALTGAGIEVPPGSQAWFSLTFVEKGVADAITEDFTGEVQRPDAQDLANDLGCAALR